MADIGGARRRREPPERIRYRQCLEQLENFVRDEIGDRRAPRSRPDLREWRVQRASTIRELKEFKEKLDTVCVHANTGKAVGSFAEILGAFGAAVGAVMSLFGQTSGPEVTNIGNLVQHTGTCIDNASKAIESLFSKEYLRKIEGVLKHDQEISLPLVEWLNFSRELNVNIQEIFGVNITSGRFNTVIQVFQEVAKLYSPARSFEATMKLMKQQRFTVTIGNDVKVEKLHTFYQYLSAFPQFADKVRGILSVLRARPEHIQLFANGFRIYQDVMDITNSSEAPSLYCGPEKSEIPSTSEVTTFCVFKAINMANSIISFTNARSIIKRGASQYSDTLETLIYSLEWELRQMEDMSI